MPIDTTEEVLSGEAVAIDILPVGFFLRILGALIDVIIYALLFVLFVWIRITFFEMSAQPGATDAILSIVGFVVCFVVVPVAMETATRGRSVGKFVIGARIVRLDGGAIGFRHAFIRAFLSIVEIYATFGAVAVGVATFSARTQRLGDLVAGTYSQRTRSPRLVSTAPSMPPHLEEWARTADVARIPDRLARRISQYLVSADQMTPSARVRVGEELVAEASACVSPQPQADPESVLTAITLVRRRRETRALQASDARAELLTARELGVAKR